jgi:hypothetical protein
MKGRPTEQLVYECMFPRPKQNDPRNFHEVLTRMLVYEVRSEVQAFYGELKTPEHKYPGLDYNHPTHRIRLSRFRWHKALFKAFDALRLTPAEISNLTKWEGTKWAKERYEKEHGELVRDTAADGIPNWIEPADRHAASPSAPAASAAARGQDGLREDTNDDAGAEDESEDELQSSIGVELNERLRARVAAHNAGDTSLPLDEAWEQWLKAAMESGSYGDLGDLTESMAALSPAMRAEDFFSSALLDAARDGQWADLPGVLHEPLRRMVEAERAAARQADAATAQAAAAAAAAAERIEPTAAAIVPGSRSTTAPSLPSLFGPPPEGLYRRTYSNLRLPGRDEPPTPELRVTVQIPSSQASEPFNQRVGA